MLAWEYWDGKRWRHLGRTAPRGALPGAGDELGFHDDTKALSPVGHGQLPPPEGHGRARDQRRHQEVDPRPHREGRLRRAGHVHAREREVGLQGRPPAAAARAAHAHVPLSRGLSRRAARAVVQRLPVHRLHRGRAHRVHDLPAVLGQARGVAGAVPRLHGEAAERSARALLPARGGARPRLAADATRPRSRRPSSTKYETMRRLAWEGGQRVVWEYWDGRDWEPLVGRRRDPGLHASRASRSSSRPTTG